MKLKEGMYVRTQLSNFCNIIAIRKIDEIDKDDNEMWLDDDVIDDYGDFYNNIHEEDIELASEYIIDVLKTGDYVLVNGDNQFLKVKYIDDCEGPIKQLYFDEDAQDIGIYNSDITQAITKEQMNLMAYKVK